MSYLRFCSESSFFVKMRKILLEMHEKMRQPTVYNVNLFVAFLDGFTFYMF